MSAHKKMLPGRQHLENIFFCHVMLITASAPVGERLVAPQVQLIIDIINIIHATLYEELNYEVTLAAMGNGIARPLYEISRLLQVKVQGYGKSQRGLLGGVIILI